MLEEINATEGRLEQLDRGESAKKRRRKYLTLDERLNNLRIELEAGDRNLQSYIDAASHQIHDRLEF